MVVSGKCFDGCSSVIIQFHIFNRSVIKLHYLLLCNTHKEDISPKEYTNEIVAHKHVVILGFLTMALQPVFK